MIGGGIWRWRYAALVALGIVCGMTVFSRISVEKNKSAKEGGTTIPVSPQPAPVAVGGDDVPWASFRGGPELSGVAVSKLPEKLRKLWKYEAGEAVTSTAAIVGERVYVGTEKGRMVALQLGDGTPIWEFQAAGAILASACVADGRVFFGDDTGRFYAVDADTGKKLWQIETGDKVFSSAVVRGDWVLVGSYDQRLLCMNVADGSVRWAFATDAQVHCSPAIWDDPAGAGVVIAGCDENLRMIDLKSGTQRWQVEVDDACAASPAIFDGHAYFGNLRGDFFSVGLTSGKVDWKLAGDNEEHPLGPISACAAVTQDAVFFATEDRKVVRVQRGTGKVEWVFRTRRGIESSPVLAGDRVFVGAEDGCVYGVSADRGEAVWKYVAGGQIKASPAVGRGRLVIGTSDGGVYCFGE